MSPESRTDVIARAAERLRIASLAAHHVPVRLGEVAGWLELAAQVHAGALPCEWCAAGDCAALDVALGVLGDPRPELIARYRRFHRR